MTPAKDLEIPAPFGYGTKCRALRVLGKGGMGTVYLAELLGEHDYSKTVALKMIRMDRAGDETLLRNFVSEAKLVADLVHPNILQVYNLGIAEGRNFIIMEYVHGVTLSRLLRRCVEAAVVFPEGMALFVLSQVLSGLAYAHAKRNRRGKLMGLVHRDVAPSNILLGFDGSVKLSDFGIAQTLFDETRLTPHVQAGRLAFMSPEQLRAEMIDARSDLYSLGLVFFEMLSGERPFKGMTLEERRMYHHRGGIPDLAAHRPSTDARILDVIRETLQNDPDDRYSSANATGVDVERIMHALPDIPTPRKFAAFVAETFPELDRHKIE